MSDLLQTFGNVLVVYTFIVSALFCVAYQLYARWTETNFGRSLMLYQVAMTLIMGFISVRVIGIETGPLPRIIVFAVVPLALTWRLIVLLRLQRLSRKEDRK